MVSFGDCFALSLPYFYILLKVKLWKGEAMQLEFRVDTQKENGSEYNIRVFVIASHEKLIGSCLPSKFRT